MAVTTGTDQSNVRCRSKQHGYDMSSRNDARRGPRPGQERDLNHFLPSICLDEIQGLYQKYNELTAWMDQERIMLSKISQSRKDRYHMMSLYVEPNAQNKMMNKKDLETLKHATDRYFGGKDRAGRD